MASCTSNKMTGITAISLLSATYTVTNNSVNAITTALLDFKINSNIIINDNIQITVPPSITVVGILNTIVITNGNVTNYSPSVTYNPNTSYTTITTTGANAIPGSTI